MIIITEHFLNAWITVMDLSHGDLATLPSEIVQQTQLEELDLSHNNLTTLPPEFGALRHLTTLDLSHNDLHSLPDSMVELTNLTTLKIYPQQVDRRIVVSLPLRKMIKRLDPDMIPFLGGVKYYIPWGDFVPTMVPDKVLYEKDTVIIRYRAQTTEGPKLVVAKYYDDPICLGYEVAVGKIVNRLYEKIPHFARLLAYDYTDNCLIIEFISGDCWEVRYYKECEETIVLDLLCLLDQIQRLHPFTHYDLHGGNIILRPIPETIVHYEIPDDKGVIHHIEIPRHFYPTIIDYGNSFFMGLPCDGSLTTCTGETRLSLGRTPAIFDPVFDGFTITITEPWEYLTTLRCRLLALGNRFYGDYPGFEELLTRKETRCYSLRCEDEQLPLTDQELDLLYQDVTCATVMPFYNKRKLERMKHRKIISLWPLINIYHSSLQGTLTPPSEEQRTRYRDFFTSRYSPEKIPSDELDELLQFWMDKIIVADEDDPTVRHFSQRDDVGRVLSWIDVNDRTAVTEKILYQLKPLRELCQYTDLFWTYDSLY